ncbi:MAG: MFS transporter [Chloroflexi bacterium]|nr:MFS transporter [Chloroflexota bacterium]
MNKLNISRTFIALRHPNFRLWFIGQVVSLVGTWMQSTAQGFLIYDLTKSAAFLGIVAFAGGLPTILFTLLGGVVADRISRRKLILITQSSMLVLAFTLATLVFTHLVQPWHIIVLAFLLGVANAFDGPARQSFIIEMVDKTDLANAIALNSMIFNLGAVIGPTIAALVYAWLGPAWCFTINGISFVAVISVLLIMKLPAAAIQENKVSPLVHLKEGLSFVFNEPRIRLILLYLAILSTFGFSLLTLIPAWAVKVLNGDVRTNGMLLSARGFGALIGALMIAYIGSKKIRGKVWLSGWIFMPFVLFAFAQISWLPASLVCLALLGWCLMAVVNVSNALTQSYVPDHLRGRVMSVFLMVFMGGTPIGSLLIGVLASHLGEPTTVMIYGFVILAALLGTFFFRSTIKTLA